MARRRKKKGRSRRSWAHLKKFWFKRGRKARRRKRKGHHMARKRKHTKRSGRRRSHHRRGRRRGSSGGAGRGLAAVKADLKTDLPYAAIWGLLEAKAKKDDSFILHKIPKPVVQLGWTGGISLALYAATMFTPNKHVRRMARITANIAAYQIAKNGGPFSSTAILGDDDMGDEMVLDAATMGALEPEGMDHTVQPGLRYDDVVTEADARV